MKKILFFAAVCLLLAAIALAFNPPPALTRYLSATDTVATFAKSSFTEMLSLLPSQSQVTPEGNGWKFTAPDGEAEFYWNTSAPSANSSAAELRVQAAPFIKAGLDLSLLPEGVVKSDTLVFPLRSKDALAMRVDNTPSNSFALLTDSYRERIGYHFQLGHYGFDLDGGHALEWAANPATNNLDLVFALDPAMLLRAGVNKDLVEGWTFGTVIVHDPDNGREQEAVKFLKPFDLR